MSTEPASTTESPDTQPSTANGVKSTCPMKDEFCEFLLLPALNTNSRFQEITRQIVVRLSNRFDPIVLRNEANVKIDG